MTFSPEFFLQLATAIVSSVAVGVGIYSGIKKDLAVTHERATEAKKTADAAHRRIDSFYMNGNKP